MYCKRKTSYLSNLNAPRNAEKPINETREGRNANALMNKYGLAYWSAGEPAARCRWNDGRA